MAKEKRAFGDESLQDTPLREELNVTEREATNVMPMAEAEATKSSIFFNPKIFEDLATISRNVHDTRRDREAYEFALEQDQFKREQELLQDKWAITKKREQDNYLSEAEVAYVTTMEDEFQKAVRENKNALETVTATDSMFQKLGDAMWERSPYLGEAFHKSRQDMFQKFNKRAIESDYVKSEAKAQYNFDTKANIIANNLRVSTNENMGEAGTQTESYTVRDAVDDLPKHLFPYLDTLSDSNWATSVNKGYNNVLQAETDRILEAYETGAMDIISARNQLLNLRAEYSYQDLTGPLNKAGEEERLATIRTTMDEATQRYIKQALFSLDSKQNKIQSAEVYNVFYEATDGELHDGGKSVQSNYLADRSFDQVHTHFDEQVNRLKSLAAAGDTKAPSELKKTLKYGYSTLLPAAAAQTLYKNAQSTEGKIRSAVDKINKMTEELDAHLNDPEYLRQGLHSLKIFDSSRSVYVDLNLNLTDRQISALYPGAIPEDVRRNYYAGMLKTLKGYVNNYNANGGLISASRAVRDAKTIAEHSVDLVNTVVKDPKSGRVEAKIDTIPQTARSLKDFITLNAIQTGDEDPTSPVIAFLKKAEDTVKDHQDPKVKWAHTMYVGQTLKELGNTEVLFGIDAKSAGLDEDNMQDVTTAVLLSNIDRLSLKRIAEADSENSLIDSRDIKSLALFEKHNGGNYTTASDYTEKRLLRVPAGRARDAVRQAVNRLLVTDFKLSKKEFKDYKAPIKEICDKVIDGNFTENGIYKYASIFRKTIPIDEAQEIVYKISDKLERVYSQTGLPKDVIHSATINEKTGTIEFKLQGVPVDAEGVDSSLLGSRIVPLNIPLMKVEGMTDSEFNDAVSALVEVTGATAMSAAATSPLGSFNKVALTDIRNKKATTNLEFTTKMSKEEIYNESMRFLNLVSDKKFQEDWFNYNKGSGENTALVSAPHYYKNAIRAIVKGPHSIFVPRQDKNLDKFIDFAYSYGYGDKVLRLDCASNTEADSLGIPRRDLQEAIRTAGGGGLFRITSVASGKHVTGVHAEGKAVDVGFGAKLGDWRTMYYSSGPHAGKVNIENMALFVKSIQHWIEDGSIDKIVVGPMMKELVKGFSQDPAYKVFRDLTNSKGERLFRMVQPEIQKVANHNDHCHIQLSKKMYNKDGTPFDPVGHLQEAVEAQREIGEKAEKALSDSIDQSITDLRKGQGYGFYDKYFKIKDDKVLDFLMPDARNLVNDTAKGVYLNLNTNTKYKTISEFEAKAVTTLYGIREANDWDAKHSGRTKQELNKNFFTKSMAQSNRFAVYKRYMGSKNAIYAMEGAEFAFFRHNTYEETPEIRKIIEGLTGKPKATGKLVKFTGEKVVDVLTDNPELRKYITPYPLTENVGKDYEKAVTLFERAGY